MFGKKTVTVIELSDESKQALQSLDADMQILSGFMQEILANQRKVLAQLSKEILTELPVSETDDSESTEDGLQVFDTKREGKYVQAPESDRIRETPFTRRPRSVQVEWLLGIMEPGKWYNSADLAKEYGNEPREVRYLRHSIGGRLREMMEDGLVDRRPTSIRGAMYEYRIRG